MSNEFREGFDYEFRPIDGLAKQVELCLIDVGSGSDTRLMVRKVLDWSAKTAEQEGSEAKQFRDSHFTALNAIYG